METSNLDTLRDITPHLKDMSYKPLVQTHEVISESGMCTIQGLTLLPGEANMALCNVSGDAKLRRNFDEEHEYVIVLKGFINITYPDQTTVAVSKHEVHHITPGAVEYHVSGKNTRVLVIVIPAKTSD